MKQLKFELVNGYGVLVDEEAEIKKGDYVTYQNDGLDITKITNAFESHRAECNKIIFAEKELKLEGVPVFEWRDFDEDEIAESVLRKQNWDTTITLPFNQGFIQGYKSNPAKYTEYEAIGFYLWARNKYGSVKPIEEGCIVNKTDYKGLFQLYIQSLQKYPKYVVMESEYFKVNGMIDEASSIRSKLFTNSEGKQEGIVKELIWE